MWRTAESLGERARLVYNTVNLLSGQDKTRRAQNTTKSHGFCSLLLRETLFLIALLVQSNSALASTVLLKEAPFRGFINKRRPEICGQRPLLWGCWVYTVLFCSCCCCFCCFDQLILRSILGNTPRQKGASHEHSISSAKKRIQSRKYWRCIETRTTHTALGALIDRKNEVRMCDTLTNQVRYSYANLFIAEKLVRVLSTA